MKDLPKLVVIIGPTASGKSSLAVKIAKRFNGEIVSADSQQIYRGMDIGTGKITNPDAHGGRGSDLRRFRSERRRKDAPVIIQNIPHYLIDIKNPNQSYSVGQYKKDAAKAINGIIKRGKLPILVGGTGLYVSVVINNWEIPKIKEDKKLRKKLEHEISRKGLAFVFRKLVKIDPEAANIVDSQNPRRIIRALEIALISGKKFSEQRKRGKPLYDILEIGLNPPFEILKEKIAERIKQMIKTGLTREVNKLIKKYGAKRKALDAIGYREIIDSLKSSDFPKFYKNFGKIENPRFDKSNRERTSLEKAIDLIQKNTLRYAKRQMTWFKKYNPKTTWLSNKNKALSLVKKFLKN